jgi:hypothetical protein
MSPRAPQLKHITGRFRITVDPQDWEEAGDELVNAVRNYAAERLQESPRIISARRDRV